MRFRRVFHPILILQVSSLFFLLQLGLISCSSSTKNNTTNSAADQGLIHGVQPKTTAVQLPDTILVREPLLPHIALGQPKVVKTNKQIHEAGEPVIISSAPARILQPGKGNCAVAVPKVMKGRMITAGDPEIVTAKDMYSRDLNASNFSIFNKLQGLKHGSIRCLIQDRYGNLWMGTPGGLTKFDGRFFTHFTTRQGMISHDVYSVLEDRQGNIWYGTEGGGIGCYDGRTFTFYTTAEGLCNDYVLYGMEDRDGKLWFGTEGGVSVVDGNTVTNYTQREGLSDNQVQYILQDKKGQIWMATQRGVTLFNGSTFQHILPAAFSEPAVNAILEDNKGSIWLMTDKHGVCRYDGNTLSQYTEVEGLSNNSVMYGLEDRKGNLWFGTFGGGLSKLERIETRDSTGQIHEDRRFIHFTENDGLSHNVVWSILQDKTGTLWLGTSEGLSRYKGNLFTYFTAKEGLSNNDIYCLFEDKQGILWMGIEGGGINTYDGNAFTHIGKEQGLISDDVFCLSQDPKGHYWFGTYEGIAKLEGNTFIHCTEQNGLLSNDITCLMHDRAGNLWIGTAKGVTRYDGKQFVHFTEQQGLVHNYIVCMMEDRSGQLWFGTRKGLSRYDHQHFLNFSVKEGLPRDDIRSMVEDRTGRIWLGSNGSGLMRLTPTATSGTTDRYTLAQYDEQDGLCNNAVFAAYEDRPGNLWFGTRFGLSKLNPDSLQLFENRLRTPSRKSGKSERPESKVPFTNYEYADGFLALGVNGGRVMLQTRNGDLWIGGNSRLSVYHPEGESPDTLAPVLQLTALHLFNEPIPWPAFERNIDTSVLLENGVRIASLSFDSLDRWNRMPAHLNLPYNNNYLTFHFNGITLNRAHGIKYRYKMEGLDPAWSTLSHTASAPYGNLPAGKYVFKVMAVNSLGVWSREIQYAFSVSPPWWKSRLAYLVYALSAIGFVIFLIWWNGRVLRARARRLQTEVTKATAEIRLEKKKSDDLLLNILPEEVAEELKAKGSADAKLISDVTVLFTDFKGFTQMSANMSPQELVGVINECFSTFDHIMQKHGIEKIKTIGDAYMAAGGLPTPNTTHAEDVVKAALEIQHYMREHKIRKEKAGEPYFEIRIGVHTGPVVAGIVGVKKFAYDIWGDAVNTASRMESSGEEGKVNISGSTYALVNDLFRCTYRGKIAAKGKGEIDMYFVEEKDE